MPASLNLVGHVFCDLTVVGLGEPASGFRRWVCRCSCGNETLVRTGDLRRGNTRSCGCLPRRIQCVNMVGQRFGRLVVVVEDPETKHGDRKWLCGCDCGETAVVRQKDLKSGNTSSCGCLHREATSAANTRHGDCRPGRRSPLYKIWAGMLRRCNNSNEVAFPVYGGRGIKVCERWHRYENFAEDMGGNFSATMSLDRVDNEKGYEPGNVRWATTTTQARNKRNNRRITFRGETRVMSEWAEVLNIPAGRVQRRLALGWAVEDALTKPLVHPPTRGTKKPRQMPELVGELF